MTEYQEIKKFTFRPSWEGSIALMEEQNRDVARHALLDFCLGKEVDLTSLPEGVRVLLNEAGYCLEFDRKQALKRQEASERKAQAKAIAKEKAKAKNRKSTTAHHEVSEAYEVNEVSEANEVNEVCEANEVDEEGKPPSSLEPSSSSQQKREKNFKEMIQEAYEYWNLAVKREGAKLSQVQTEHINEERKEKIALRLQEYGMEAFKKAVDNAARSAFLNEYAGNAPVTFDWFLDPGNFTKTLEGNFERVYANKPIRHRAVSKLTDEEMKNYKGF